MNQYSARNEPYIATTRSFLSQSQDPNSNLARHERILHSSQQRPMTYSQHMAFSELSHPSHTLATSVHDDLSYQNLEPNQQIMRSDNHLQRTGSREQYDYVPSSQWILVSSNGSKRQHCHQEIFSDLPRTEMTAQQPHLMQMQMTGLPYHIGPPSYEEPVISSMRPIVFSSHQEEVSCTPHRRSVPQSHYFGAVGDAVYHHPPQRVQANHRSSSTMPYQANQRSSSAIPCLQATASEEDEHWSRAAEKEVKSEHATRIKRFRCKVAGCC